MLTDLLFTRQEAPESLPVAAIEEKFTYSSLALGAAKTLGYRSLMEEEKQGQKALNFFWRALIDNGITPFETSKVYAYRTDKAKSGKLIKKLRNFFFWFCILFLLISFGAVIDGMYYKNEEWLPVLILSLFGALTSVIIWLGLDQSDHIFWARQPIGKYKRKLPENVIALALDLKKKCPFADFFIDSLCVGENQRAWLFLAQIGDTDYYLRGWEES